MSTSGKTSIETNVQICQKMVISLRELMDETKNLRLKLAQMESDLMLLYEPSYLDLLKSLEVYGDNDNVNKNGS